MSLIEPSQTFQNYMIDAWSECYYDLAGCNLINDFDSDDVVDFTVDEIQLAFYDDHRKEIIVGYYEEGPVLERVDVRNSEKYITSTKEGPLWKLTRPANRKISGFDLMKRYGWVTLLFRWIDDVNEIGPSAFLPESAFEEEREDIKEDPYLAMYWLIRFGFSANKKYIEVSRVIKENKLHLQLPFLSTVLAFFEQSASDYEIRIPDHFGTIQAIFDGAPHENLFMKGLFLKRKAYIIFSSQIFEKYDAPVETAFDSVFVYPDVEPNLFKRIYWLLIYVYENKLFDQVDTLLEKRNTNPLPFISDLLTFFAKEPTEDSATNLINLLFNNLEEHQQIYLQGNGYYEREFITMMSGKCPDKAQLKRLAQLYFDDKSSDKYKSLEQQWSKN